jgi:hypothetical protein
VFTSIKLNYPVFESAVDLREKGTDAGKPKWQVAERNSSETTTLK